MAYIEDLSLVVAIAFAATIVAKWISRPADWRTIAGLIFMIMLFHIDPYSYGARGGDVGFDVYVWQQGATVAFTCLLVAALVLVRKRQNRAALMALMVETAGFVAINALYVLRDGFWERMLRGYGSSPLPLLAVATGLIVRFFLIWHRFPIRKEVDGSP